MSAVAAGAEVATNSTLFVVIETIGTVAFAASGVLAAARAHMDWLGAMVLALGVALGGGTVRSLLLGQTPVSWLQQPRFVYESLGTAIVVLLILRIWPSAKLETSTPLLIADAAGLGAFVILGTQIGLTAHLSSVLAVMLGVLTGVGGGIIRDVLTQTKPEVLVGQIYAVAGIVGGALFVILRNQGVNTEVAVWSSVALVFAVRMIAIRQSWNLPRALRTQAQSDNEAGDSPNSNRSRESATSPTTD
jgi:uncharacterized membrane protein YeiH